MKIHEYAGKHLPEDKITDIDKLIRMYYSEKPDMSAPETRVSFGTSGHRGSSFKSSFTESHILAITQAICDYRKKENITGPVFIGYDTHALSRPAFETALEVLAANETDAMIADNDYTAIVEALKDHLSEYKKELDVKPDYELTYIIALNENPEYIKNRIINDYGLIYGTTKFLENQLQMLGVKSTEIIEKYGNK